MICVPPIDEWIVSKAYKHDVSSLDWAWQSDTFYSTDLDRFVGSRKSVSFPVLRSGSSS